MPESPLRPIDGNLWVVDRPLGIAGIHVGARMTVIRLANGDLFLHSPVTLDAETRAALDALGPVRHIVAPNKLHHLFFADAAAAYPAALRYAPPGLPEKQPQLDFHEVLGNDAPPAWSTEIDQCRIAGMPYVEEVAFHHRASRTLLLGDFAFNMREGRTMPTRVWMQLMGVSGRFGPTRMFKWFVRDPAATRASLDVILAWDFDRVVVGHGVVLQRGGRRSLRDAYTWMG